MTLSFLMLSRHIQPPPFLSPLSPSPPALLLPLNHQPHLVSSHPLHPLPTLLSPSVYISSLPPSNSTFVHTLSFSLRLFATPSPIFSPSSRFTFPHPHLSRPSGGDNCLPLSAVFLVSPASFIDSCSSCSFSLDELVFRSLPHIRTPFSTAKAAFPLDMTSTTKLYFPSDSR